jgi:hypothetical protein
VKRIILDDFTQENLGLIVVRSLDQSKLVRHTLYERLYTDNFNFEKFSESDRLSLIKNGLSDHDFGVKECCQKYLIK